MRIKNTQIHIMTRNTLAKEEGFTLVELLLYIGLTITIVAAMSTLLILLLEGQAKNQSIAEVDQQGEAAIQEMTQAIRNASTITSPSTGASAAATTLATYSGATNPTIFDESSGVLQVTEGVGAAVPLTNSRVTISALSFENLSKAGSPGTIQVTFTVTHNNPSGRNEFDYTRDFTASASLKQP